VGLLCCDLDNTLVDRAAAFRRWATAFAATHGEGAELVDWLVEIDGDGFGPRPDFYILVRDRVGITAPVSEIVADYYRDFLPQYRADVDIPDALARVRAAGWKVAIVTNGPATQVDKIRHAGLDPLVDTWCVSEIEGTRKPDPGLLRLAAQRTGVPLGGAWMIGDDAEADIGAAHAAGIRSVWLRRGRAWPLRELAPTFEAATFGEAVDRVLSCRG
jgi:HAD superfamily hydrolase (TIGR01509 family)